MELIKVYQGNIINARDLWEFLEIKSEFNHWIKRNLLPHFTEGKDFSSKTTKNKNSGKGRPTKEYYITLETAKKLAMMAKTSRGEDARDYFIQCEKVAIEAKNNKRLAFYFKLEGTKEKLLKNIVEIGGTRDDFMQIDLEGRKVLFNGKPIPDEELHLVLLKGRDFATELTNLSISQNKEIDIDDVGFVNRENHYEVRKTIINRANTTPEDMLPEEDVSKLKGAEGGQIENL